MNKEHFKNIHKLFTVALLTLSLTTVSQAKVNSSANLDEQRLKALTPEFSNWGIDQNEKGSINLAGALKKSSKKKEVVVAVIDTGIDSEHPLIKNNLYLPSSAISSERYGVDFSKGKTSLYKPVDTHGHGTHIAGIIKGVYGDVKILALKYFNPAASGQDNLNSTIEALRYAVDQNVDVINYSGGGPEPALEELSILKKAQEKGILVVAASGNEQSNIDNKDKAYYPASYGLNNIITVTAYDSYLEVLPSSNYGSKTVDIAAPGNRIKSSIPYGRAGYLTGTSQATAFVSGVAALLKANFPSLSATAIKDIIRDSAHKEKSLVGKCNSEGRVDATMAFDMAERKLNPSSSLPINRAVANKKSEVIYIPLKK